MNDNRILWTAFILSLLLHLVLAGVFWRLPLSADPVLARGEPEPDEGAVEMILEPESQDSAKPTRFTMVPERLATEEAPRDPQFASLYNSRAADRIQGADQSVPSAAKQSEVAQVEIHKDDFSGADGLQMDNQVLPRPAEKQVDQGARGKPGQTGAGKPGDRDDDRGQWALPRDDPSQGKPENKESKEQKRETPRLDDWWGDSAPDLLKEGRKGQAGDRGFDFNQAESGTQGAGVSYVGNFSLSTYEWAFAPWLQKFGNQLYRHWIPPYAYSHLGMIHGKTRVRLVIARSGKLESFEILATEGHESLHEASEAALKAFAPYHPLPADFPDENLVLTCELVYPALR